MQSRIAKPFPLALLALVGITVLIPIGRAQKSGAAFSPNIPKTWDEAALKDWATPVAGLNVRPTHMPTKEYYALPVENLKTYPVYYPGREPEGYWEMLQKVGPKPLIEPEKLKSDADWIEAGRNVFLGYESFGLRTFDPEFIAAVRKRETFGDRQPLPDGTVALLMWVPTERGVALSQANCAACHLPFRQDGTTIPGAPSTSIPFNLASAGAIRNRVRSAKSLMDGGGPFFMGPASLGMWLYQAYSVPWRKDAASEQWKSITEAEYTPLRAAFRGSGGVPRWNGSLLYPAKTPDLIGIKDRKYIDHTATHLHRGIGDLMRYAALVSFAEATDFGPHRMLSGGTKRVQTRLPDEALYALAFYIYSLKPPPNPNPFDEQARAGERIFARECAACHTPPLYTNNQLTLAEGFTPPKDKPASLDVLPISVGTDPGLALKTRKGTGYYKVPSLKGVWYRGRYLHDGSVASLEEMFNPDRLKDTHVPGGFIPAGVKTRAIQGHEFGLKLNAEEREQLIAFLKTL